MRVIKTRRDLDIPAYGRIPKGTRFNVAEYNKRFVYVMVSPYTRLRLARKGDCEIIY